MTKTYDREVEALITRLSKKSNWIEIIKEKNQNIRKDRYIIGGIIAKQLAKGNAKASLALRNKFANSTGMGVKYIYILSNCYNKLKIYGEGSTLAEEFGLSHITYLHAYAQGDKNRWRIAINLTRKHGIPKSKEMLRRNDLSNSDVVFMRFAMTAADREFVKACLDDINTSGGPMHQGDCLIAILNDYTGRSYKKAS